MPQNTPLQPTAKTVAGVPAPLNLDNLLNLRMTPLPQKTALGLTANTVIKAGAGRVGKAQVIVGGSTAGGLYDCLTTSAAVASNQIATVPPLTTAQVTALSVDMVYLLGLTYIAGTGQTLAVNYE